MEHPQQPTHQHTGIPHDAVIQALTDCVAACEACASACLDADDVTPLAHCIELCRDASDVCSLAARLLLRDSEVARSLLVVCAEACKHCAAACGAHADESCQRCAAACTACEQACHALQEDSL